jgi:uncharacterized membrane protein YphA (DoxX/SURF4 family)
MGKLQNLETWADQHHPKWLDIIRILLGVILFLKGVDFVRDTESLMNIMHNSKFPWVSLILAHYVAFAHLVGGLLIMLGLLTRVAVLFQLPILLGAVIFINAQKGFYSVNSELWFSLLVLLLLLFFLFYGSGPLSVDAVYKKYKDL